MGFIRTNNFVWKGYFFGTVSKQQRQFSKMYIVDLFIFCLKTKLSTGKKRQELSSNKSNTATKS